MTPSMDLLFQFKSHRLYSDKNKTFLGRILFSIHYQGNAGLSVQISQDRTLVSEARANNSTWREDG